MQAIILAAGYGTRLYPLTKTTPKALLPVLGKPVIEYFLQKIIKLKLKRIIIVTNEKYYSKFLEWLSQYIPAHPLVVVSDKTFTEDEKLGAIGDLNFVLKEKKIYDDILLFTSDMIFSFSLNGFASAIEKKREENWILLYKLKDIKEASKYGVASLDESSRVIEFREKPENPFSPYVAFGIYYLPQQKLKLIDKFLKEKKKNDALGEYFHWLIENDILYAYVQKGGIWIDIGDKMQYQNAEELVKKSGRFRWLR